MVTEQRQTPATTGGEPRLSGHEALLHARHAMDDAIIAPARDAQRWGERLHAALVELTDILQRHRSTSERAGGSLEAMAAVAPRLIPRIERCRAEHVTLIERAEALREAVARQLAAGDVDVTHLRRDGGRLQSDVTAHMAASIDLLYEAYERDMGGEG